MSIVTNIREAADRLRARMTTSPRVGLVLGSGLGGFADDLADVETFAYDTIPHFPVSSVEGHSGKLVVGRAGETPVCVMAGRVHAYEGYSATDVVFPARVLGSLGIETLILTNAAGAVNTTYQPGELMIMSDHLNLTGMSPLVGPELPELGHRFTDLSQSYDLDWIAACERAAADVGITTHKGVYAGLLGPSFETPAEIRMLRAMGADAVGMSTVLETIACRQMGVRVLGLSCVTNMAAGILQQKIDHEEVIEIGRQVQSSFNALMRALLPVIAGGTAEGATG